MNLSRWNPFRFTRRAGADGRSDGSQHASQGQQQQQGQAASGSQQMGSPGVPQAWLDRGGLPDPLRMMATMMSHPFGSLTRLDRWFGDFSPAAFEPRIDVVNIEVVPTPEHGWVDIEIGYQIRATKDDRTLVYPFYVIGED